MTGEPGESLFVRGKFVDKHQAKPQLCHFSNFPFESQGKPSLDHIQAIKKKGLCGDAVAEKNADLKYNLDSRIYIVSPLVSVFSSDKNSFHWSTESADTDTFLL